jgi:hypothetical protein
MAQVRFEVHHRFAAPARAVWDELVDWAGHAAWIPMTRVVVDPVDGDPTAVGSSFTAWTGPGRLALEDRMRVVEAAWDDEAGAGRCTVDKLGPVLTGQAGFTVAGADGAPTGSDLRWWEDVTVPHLPQALAPVAARLGAAGFRLGMRRLARRLPAVAAPARAR